jgi:hypothetical protein
MDTKRRVLVVGGRDFNVPTWAEDAFEIELITGEDGRGNGLLEPRHQADAVVIMADYCSHNFSQQAQRLANEWDVPWFGCRGGWASAVERASLSGLDWFANAIESAAKERDDKDLLRKEAEEAVQSAWTAVIEDGRARVAAAEKRLGKERRHRERLEVTIDAQRRTIERLRDGAEARIIGEIRKQAKQVRDVELKKLVPVKGAVAEVTEALESIGGLLRSGIARLKTASESLESSMNGGSEKKDEFPR